MTNMRRQTLTDFMGSVLDAPMSRLRNWAIGLAICMAAVIGAIYFLAAAAFLALEPKVGAIPAHLILAAAFIVLAGLAIAIPRMIAAHSEGIAERAQAQAKAMPKNERLAMIIEALVLGFSASATRKTAKADKP
jgi:hypothetical protein